VPAGESDKSLKLTRLLVRAHATDVDASVAFYEKLRFVVRDDAVNGNGTRTVEMTHRDMPDILLLLRHAPGRALARVADLDLPPEDGPVLFSLVVDDYLEWDDHLATLGLQVERRDSHPWGVWIYLRDPADNLIALTTFDSY
jgi:catechol 2,3-dioxygenase-like lactoylglutathione lyase family enzyme